MHFLKYQWAVYGILTRLYLGYKRKITQIRVGLITKMK